MYRLLPVLALSAVLGCAGGRLSTIDEKGELPEDVPQEFRDQYRSLELSQVDLPPEPVKPSAAKKKISKKGIKKKEEPFTVPNRRPRHEPIGLGEMVYFDITYLGMVAGSFVVTHMPYKTIAGRRVYHFRADAVSSKIFSVFYRLKDRIESFVDYEGLFSHRFQLSLDETKQVRNSLELNDSEKQETFYWNRWNQAEKGYSETKVVEKIPRFPQDSLSALYHLRMMEYGPPGSEIVFPLVSEGKWWMAAARVDGREWAETALGRVPLIRLQIITHYDNKLKQEGKSLLWITDDVHKVPVRLSAKVRIGTIEATLTRWEKGTPTS